MSDISTLDIGFTGTQKGMTAKQLASFYYFLKSLRDQTRCLLIKFHQGCCVGADEHATGIAKSLHLRIVGHPPSNHEKLSRLAVDWSDELRPELPYLDRNKEIVHASSHLIACSKTQAEEIRSGTWSTVRYAKKINKTCTVVLPDGKIVRAFTAATRQERLL